MRRVLLAFVLLLLPASAFAQATIAGTVRDASGAVLPGVTVEVSSPALIEKVRSAVTDGTGQYRVEDLRPGTYDVTFSLSGFSTLKREGVELSGVFTAQINADLKVGAVAETITVTGETPIVDVQSAKRQMTLNNDVVRSIPNTRNYNSMVFLVPGVTTNVNDVTTGIVTTQFPIHGGRNNEGRLSIDGLNIVNPPGGGQPPTYVADVGNAQEVSFVTNGGLGESETAGLVMNLIPKTGGNKVSGSIFFSGTGEKLESDNLTQALRDQGLQAATPTNKVYDLNGSIGGPLRKDKIWYFANARTQGSTKIIANIFYNNNAGDATKWTYSPNLSQPEYTDRTWENGDVRITWQITPRNKLSGFWDEQVVCRACEGTTYGITDPARISPEAGGLSQYKPLRVTQLSWSSPATSRLLFEAGLGTTYYGWGNFERDPNPTHDMIRVAEQCTRGCAANGGIPGIVYRSQDYALNYTGAYAWRASTSYITGAHSLKVGYQGTYMTDDRTWFTNSQNLAYRVDNGVPNQLTELISPWVNNARAGWHALFGQEQWTRGRLSLQAALRYDHAGSWFPAQQEGPSRFLPVPMIFPETKGVDSYNDITPRFGAAYDVFGNGRTAIRANIGKYLEGVGVQLNYANSNPTLRVPTSTGPFQTQGVTRTWTDANGNFTPDCNLLNPQAQDLRPTGGDFCGQMSNVQFGQPVLTNNYDPALLHGWGVRASDWNLGLSVQQQIASRASIEVAYSRRWYNGFTVTDNTLVTGADYGTYSVTAPSDPRLPGGGGYSIAGLYDVAPSKSGQFSNLITDSRAYGDEYQYFNGLDVTLNVRMRNGLTVQGGTSTGKTVADACGVHAGLPEASIAIGAGLATSTVSTTSPYCHADFGWLTQLRGLATYTVPKIDVQFSGVMQSKPGALLAANYAVTAAAVQQSLGRAPSGNVTSVTVNLLAPGQMYGDRINQLDFRAAKILKFGRTKTMIGVDMYNALNSSAILTYNNTYAGPGGTWLQPNSILTGRMTRISAEVSW
ncbi:MAG TPA: TonB-dependent receptor [Vicinamibacterales bacterium]|nr:TonB-dependent receptor [Vicinamibacterales bacterium]